MGLVKLNLKAEFIKPHFFADVKGFAEKRGRKTKKTFSSVAKACLFAEFFAQYLQIGGECAMIYKTDEKQGMRKLTRSEPERVQVRWQRAQTVGLRGRGGTDDKPLWPCGTEKGLQRLSIPRRLFPVIGTKEA